MAKVPKVTRIPISHGVVGDADGSVGSCVTAIGYITASNQACNLSHVSLWRDVYYTNGPESAILWGRPDAPITMGPDEFFVLGDNTVISKDARYWTQGVELPAEDLDVAAGRVPGRFMLGKAFFVYWPAGYRPVDAANVPGFIPNFGDMRFIH